MASQLRVFGNGDVEGSRASLTFCASVSPFVGSLQGAVRHQNDEKKAVVWRNRMSWDQCQKLQLSWQWRIQERSWQGLLNPKTARSCRGDTQGETRGLEKGF